MKSTITITFGDCAENHVGMQKLGNISDCGFNNEDLERCYVYFEALECVCEYIHLNKGLPEEIEAEDAYILIVRKGVNAILNNSLGSSLLFKEHRSLEWDTKAKMRGRVVNKRARYNVCYSSEDQEPNYNEGKGRVISYEKVPLLQKIREELPKALGEKACSLYAEGNLYYDISKTYIGFHGDSERKKVVALRLGETFPLYYQWYQRSKPIGTLFTFQLNHGDMYVMSEKATGYDWKRRIKPTLRHAASLKKSLVFKK